MADNKEVVRLLTDMKESLGGLERQMVVGFTSLEARFDAQEVRLERHAALLQSGSRWINRMNQWHEKQDRLMADLQKRIVKLEKEKNE